MQGQEMTGTLHVFCFSTPTPNSVSSLALTVLSIQVPSHCVVAPYGSKYAFILCFFCAEPSVWFGNQNSCVKSCPSGPSQVISGLHGLSVPRCLR